MKQGSGKPRVLAGLAARVGREVAAKQARLAAAGREDLDLIRRRLGRIAEDFYDIGEALARLERPGVAEALGQPSFEALLAHELPGVSSTRAGMLIAIVRQVKRASAVRWGQERSAALIELAGSTTAVDSAQSLARAKLRLPSGRILDVPSASTNDLKRAAKQIRAARQRGNRRGVGRTTTATERAQAAHLQAELHKLGVPHARVTAVATKPGAAANVRIEFVPLAALPTLKRAL